MIVCRKQANKLEDLLKAAKELLQDMIEAKNVPIIEAIHRLRDLARVLDRLKLQEECLVVGDCAINLAQALGLRAREFQWELAWTISFIAGLDAYELRMRPLFIQAISICEASVIEDESNFAKMNLLLVLRYAGTFANNYPALSAQWLGRAIDLIAELPSAILTDACHSEIYSSYVLSLCKLKQYPKALAAGEHAVALIRSLASKHDEPRYKLVLARTLQVHGRTLGEMGDLGNALDVEHEAVSLLRALHIDGQAEKDSLFGTLDDYGNILFKMGRLEDELSVQRERVSLCRALVAHREEETERFALAAALASCGRILTKMGLFEDALSVGQEAVSLFRAFVAHGEVQKENLACALQICGRALFKMGLLEDALSVKQEAVSLFRALVAHDQVKYEWALAVSLMDCGDTLSEMRCLEDALSAKREGVSLCRGLVIHEEKKKKYLAVALQNYAATLVAMDRLEDARSALWEALSLFCALAVHGREKCRWKLVGTLRVYGMILVMRIALKVERSNFLLSLFTFIFIPIFLVVQFIVTRIVPMLHVLLGTLYAVPPLVAVISLAVMAFGWRSLFLA